MTLIACGSPKLWRRGLSRTGGFLSFVGVSILMLACGSALAAEGAAPAKPPGTSAPMAPAGGAAKNVKPATWAPPISTGALSAEQTKKLDGAAEYSAKLQGKAVLVMHNAAIVYERYDNGGGINTPNPLASGTKSFTGVGAMFAVQDGLFTLDEKVSDTIAPWATDEQKKQITVRHLLTLSSGLRPDNDTGGRGGRGGRAGGGGDEALRAGIPSTPGTRAMIAGRDDWFAAALAAPVTGKPGGQFAYGGNHFYAFGALLEAKLASSEIPQKKAWDYYTTKLFDPIGLKVARIGRDKQGHPNLPGGAQLNAREWAKFGQFVLWNGAWKQADGSMKQLLKPELLAKCFEPSTKNPSYGLTWWLLKSGDTTSSAADNGGRQDLAERMRRRSFEQQSQTVLGPDGKPVTVYMAAGLGKQRLFVLPQYQLVVVRFAPIDAEGAKFDNAAFLKPIVEAFVSEKSAAPDAPAPKP